MGTGYHDFAGGAVPLTKEGLNRALIRLIRARIGEHPDYEWLALAEKAGDITAEVRAADERRLVTDAVVVVTVAGETFEIPRPEGFEALFDD